jgi:hypothetical protein
MKHIKLFEEMNNADDNWQEKYLDQQGYYKGTDEENWGPTKGEINDLIESLRQMGFNIKNTVSDWNRGKSKYSFAIEATLDMNFINEPDGLIDKYIIDFFMPEDARYLSHKPEAKNPMVPRGFNTSQPPFETMEKFLASEITYNEYIDAFKKMGLTKSDADSLAFYSPQNVQKSLGGRYSFGKTLKYGKEFGFSERCIDAGGEEIAPVGKREVIECLYPISFYQNNVEEANENISHEYFLKLPELIQQKIEEIENFNSTYDSSEYEEDY